MALTVKGFPSDYSQVFSSIDLNNPYMHTNVGLFRSDIGSSIADVYVYIPDQLEFSAWNLTVLAPGPCDPALFIDESGWKDLADARKFMLIVAVPAKDWLADESAFELMERLDAAVGDKQHYDAQRFCSYAAAYGKACSVLLEYVNVKPATYAGIAFLGCPEFHSGENADKTAVSDLLPYIPACEVPLPAYFEMAGSRPVCNGVVEQFKERNKTSNAPFVKGDLDVYLALPNSKRDSVNEQVCASVAVRRVSCGDDQSSVLAWDYLTKVIRTSGVGPGGLHPYRTLEEWGAQRRELVIDGVRRFWIEYAPERNVSREEKRPLVVFLHGGSQTGYSGMYAPEWMNVAESRDFILAMPTGTVRDFGTSAPHPAWNAKRSNELFDDEKFLRQMIDDMASRYAVDRGRVYVTGHSMGSAMTQRCALALPELFAAAASNSGIVAGGFMGDFDSVGVREDIQAPAIWIQMGEHDVGGGTFAANPKAERTCRYWVKRGNLGDFDSFATYSCGRYKTKVWSTENGVPLLSYTLALDKPHAVMPQDAWFYYDEFFCKFSRGEDGTLRYMGKPISD